MQLEYDCTCGKPGPVTIEGTPYRFKDGTIDGGSIERVTFPTEADVICVLASAMGASPDGYVTIVWTNERIRFTRDRIADVIHAA